MKKLFILLCFSFMTSFVFANSIVIDNKTDYPTNDKFGKIAVEWAASAKAIQKANKNILNGKSINPNSLTMLTQNGRVELSSPNNAKYFRLVVWSNDKQEPALLTNWVYISPNKTYVVNQKQLVPKVLLSGTGC
ncbi:hypothetical protein [Legionella bononiensis]|uniref:Uncharacterized protein n=1 Tax=Legionella bononiensis TaxID=2793102 RepID=A0ABS1WDV5_9GAMM|nr:hypothetical protein [Legionella bononiensis]MBL7479585.1 hypothetical protein [Legionella bononiensis]MBL7527538.1 hypothetical protein [Legionella bononiensis]